MAPAFHLFLPQIRLTHAEIVERAKAAEAAGFEGIAFMDHLAPPLAEDQDQWEAMALAGWVLAATTTLVVGHLVLCDPFRQPAVLARQVTSLDHASGGRFELGIGWGSVPDELVTFGIGTTEPAERVARLRESLTVLRALWTGETVDHHGEHLTLVGARQRPVPTRPIPVTIGGTGPRTMALVREHADWWNVPAHHLDRLAERRPLAGDARVSIQTMAAVVPDEANRAEVTERAERRYGRTPMGRHLAVGSPAELTEHFGARHAQGVDRFYVWFTDTAPPATLAAFAEVIQALR